MRKIINNRSLAAGIRFHVAALLTSALIAYCASTASAAAIANFDDGAGDYPGSSLDSGWATAFTNVSGNTVTVTNASPIDGGTDYLSVSNAAAGNTLIQRQYGSNNGLDPNTIHPISWKFRYDGNLSTFNSFSDRVNFFGNAAAVTGTGATNSWIIAATGDTTLGTSHRFYVYDNAVPGSNGAFTAGNFMDTGVDLIAGSIYSMEVNVDPTTKSYTARIINETTLTDSGLLTGLDFRNGSAAGNIHTYLHLGLTSDNAGQVLSLDSIQVGVIVPIPEPSSCLLLGLGALVLLPRTRRRRGNA